MATATLALGLAMAWNVSAQNVYRWLDEEGKVHYTKTLPPEAAKRPYDVLSASGILIERVTDPTARHKPAAEEKSDRPEPLYSDAEKQAMADRLLLLKYHSEQEILEAMELEIDHLKYDERLLDATYASVLKTLQSQISLAASSQRSGLEVDATLREDIAHLQERLQSNRKTNQELELRKENIRARFREDLDRYRALVSQYQKTEPGS